MKKKKIMKKKVMKKKKIMKKKSNKNLSSAQWPCHVFVWIWIRSVGRWGVALFCF